MSGDLKELDDLITGKDYRVLDRINRIRRQMTGFFDKKKLLSEMLEIIDGSECVTFSSDRSKKFIDPLRPVFKLKLSTAKAVPLHSEEFKYRHSQKNTEKEIVDFRMSVIYKEVVSPFSEIMRVALKDIDPGLLAEIPDELELARFIVTSIFQVKIESNMEDVNDDPICYVEYTL